MIFEFLKNANLQNSEIAKTEGPRNILLLVCCSLYGLINMKSVCLLLALAALLSLAASQSYLIELPEVYSTSVNITIKSANSLTLLGNYYADQSNLAARLDAVGVHNVQGNITIFAHSTFVDAQRGTGYEIILDNGVFGMFSLSLYTSCLYVSKFFWFFSSSPSPQENAYSIYRMHPTNLREPL